MLVGRSLLPSLCLFPFAVHPSLTPIFSPINPFSFPLTLCSCSDIDRIVAKYPREDVSTSDQVFQWRPSENTAANLTEIHQLENDFCDRLQCSLPKLFPSEAGTNSLPPYKSGNKFGGKPSYNHSSTTGEVLADKYDLSIFGDNSQIHSGSACEANRRNS